MIYKYEIGEKVRINPDSQYYDQAMEKGGDGFGVVVKLYDDNDDYFYCVKWSNGHRNEYRDIDLLPIKEKKIKREIRIEDDPWGEETKFEYESHINENSNFRKIGKKVRIVPSAVLFAGKIGVIIDYFPSNDWNPYDYKVRFDNGKTCWYRLEDLLPFEGKEKLMEDDPWGEETTYESHIKGFDKYVSEEYEGGPPTKEPLIVKHIGEIDLKDNDNEEDDGDDDEDISSLIDYLPIE